MNQLKFKFLGCVSPSTPIPYDTSRGICETSVCSGEVDFVSRDLCILQCISEDCFNSSFGRFAEVKWDG